MSGSMKIEFTAGTSISQACEQAQAVANKIDVTIEFGFNGVECLALPGGTAEKLAKSYASEIRKDGAYRMATSR